MTKKQPPPPNPVQIAGVVIMLIGIIWTVAAVVYYIVT